MQKLLFDITDTVNEISESNQEENKTCTKCDQSLPLSDFSPSGGANYLRRECKKCNYQLSKTRKELKIEHGEPPENYICPICLKNAEEVKGFGGKNLGPWVVDHNHKTKKFRGWLCHKCNRIFNDDCTPELLIRAMNYLQKE